MDGPLKIDPRYRKAAIRGIRFGLVFALVCVWLSVLSWVGVINNAVGGPGDGRFTSPFNSIANFNTLAADDPGDYIFVYQGSGAYSGAFTLLNTQQLIGHGVGLSISPNLSIAAASRPTIANVTLASGNTVMRLEMCICVLPAMRSMIAGKPVSRSVVPSVPPLRS